MPARTESSHVQVDEADHDECECGGWQSGAPVVNTEVLKQKHCAPIVERRLLQPRTAVKIRSDASTQAVFDGVRGVESVEHFVRDLRISRLVGAHQSEAITAKKGVSPYSRKKTVKTRNTDASRTVDQVRQPLSRVIGQIRSRWFQSSFHFQQFSNGRAAASRSVRRLSALLRTAN